ncbi:hypothetical protein P9869_10120 [Streptomyces ossamyceticus]|nr:hypothetical protein [Streptomyces ossamyceticus]
MRLSRSFAPVAVALALVLSLPYEAIPNARVETGNLTGPRHARGTADRPDPFGAACNYTVFGSRVVGYCFNPYPDPDRVRLHIECARWWDIDSDGAPVETGPAQTVRFTGRCWKEVRAVWFSHQRPDD